MTGTARLYALAGSVLCLLAVAFGAFGAHALKQVIAPELMAVFDTAVRYQMFHASSLLLLGILLTIMTDNTRQIRWFNWAGGLFIFGLLLFCGSLYAVALTGIKMLGAITPIGGVAFILAWLCLIVGLCVPVTRSQVNR